MTKATEKLARLKATPGASTYVKPQAMEWQTTQFEKIWIKVLYDNAEKGETTCLLRLEPGAHVPFHKHPELEQVFVLEGSMYDHDGVARVGDFVWRTANSYHENHTDEGAIVLAIYRKPNIFQHSVGFGAQGKARSRQ